MCIHTTHAHTHTRTSIRNTCTLTQTHTHVCISLVLLYVYVCVCLQLLLLSYRVEHTFSGLCSSLLLQCRLVRVAAHAMSLLLATYLDFDTEQKWGIEKWEREGVLIVRVMEKMLHDPCHAPCMVSGLCVCVCLERVLVFSFAVLFSQRWSRVFGKDWWTWRSKDQVLESKEHFTLVVKPRPWHPCWMIHVILS